jgi:hypothetical protein
MNETCLLGVPSQDILISGALGLLGPLRNHRIIFMVVSDSKSRITRQYRVALTELLVEEGGVTNKVSQETSLDILVAICRP